MHNEIKNREILRVLKRTFGFSAFRPHQQAIVEAVLSGRDVFAALPTGGGKSLCYQLPSLLLPQRTVVVSPLIALMEDQVEGALQNGVPAAFLNSSLSDEKAREVFRSTGAGDVRLLYVSPERLAHEGFRATLAGWGVSLFAIDEAHCISEWGHEFRPEYRTLTVLRTEFPDTPVAAFTATATRRVQDDVIRSLGLADPYVVRGNFDRPEIFYRVVRKTKVNDQILSFVSGHGSEAGIVYRGTRKSVEETAAHLRNAGVSALAYHAGLGAEVRRRHQKAFVRDEVQVIVATIAFGMGIDKSNVRWVVHGDLPKSLEAYYQETGRAGRDGEDADTCLFYGPGDSAKIRYHIDRMEIRAEREQAERNLREVLRFAESGVCRRTQLLRHFDQDHSGTCKRCDVCAGETQLTDHTVEAQKVMSAILRTGERFGRHHIADIVAGAENERIRQFGHHTLPTFGAGQDRPKTWWLDVCGDLESGGLVRRTDGERSGLCLTDRGREVLYGREQFFTIARVASHAERTVPKTEAPDFLRDEQQRLFDCLRALRLRLARETGIPPYMVFSDRTLKSFVKNRPEDHTALLRVHGVGETKAQRWGPPFLGAIRSFLTSGEC